MNIPDSVINRTKKFEGNIPYMYLDTVGNVTIGVGNLIASSSSTADLPLVKKTNESVATAAEKKADWENVKKQPPGRIASFYDKFTLLKIKQVDIDSLLDKKLKIFQGELEDIFSEYSTFPQQVQEGLMDMIFNLGKTNLLKFTNFINAVKSKNWSKAASECKRKGIPEERNEEIKKLFESAVVG